MTRTRPRRAAALLVAAVLLSTAMPAAAAPPAWNVPSLVDALTVWLTSLWSGEDPGETPTPGWAGLGGVEEPAFGPPPGSAGESSDGPTADPQLGGELDPDG